MMDGMPSFKPAESSMSGLLLCFSHLRWNFVFQRPQHMMTRFAERLPVVFWEEPETGDFAEPALDVRIGGNVRIAVPKLPAALDQKAANAALALLLDRFLAGEPPVRVRWYYTPMMLAFSRGVAAGCIWGCRKCHGIGCISAKTRYLIGSLPSLRPLKSGSRRTHPSGRAISRSEKLGNGRPEARSASVNG